MSGSVNPQFLQNLANPPAASPDYWGKQMQNMNALQDYQAKQAIADITQQSIGPDGQVDPAKFNLLMSRSPQAAWAGLPAMQAQGQAQSAQATGSTNQLGFNDAQQTQIAKGFGAMINQPDSAQTPEAYKAQLQQLVANRTIDPSHFAAATAAIDALGPNPDPTTMRTTATRMLITGLSTADIAHNALPSVQMATGPQGTMPYVVQPAPVGGSPTGAMTPAPGGFKAGVAPGDMQEYVYQPVDANGKPTGAPIRMSAPKGTVFPSTQGSQITPAAPTSGTGTGTGTGGPSVFPPGYTGRFSPTATTPPAATTPAPVTTPPAATTPPAPVTTPPATTPPAVSTPSGTGVAVSPPMGAEDTLKNDIGASAAANTAMPDQQKRLIAGQHAMDALKLADTGPSTGFVARANAFLKAQGITTVPQGQLSDTDYRQLLQKNLIRFAQGSAQGVSPHTDLGLTTKLESNANADEMLAGANRTVLLQDMGILKRDIAQTQEMPPASIKGDVVKHIGSYSANTAPEAFMWNSYSSDERAAIEAQYAKDGQTQKLHDSLAKAVKLGAIPDPRKPATPPTVIVRPQSSNVQPNALAAYA